MFFDARSAKLLKPGQHMVIDGCPGLRLTVSATRKTWIYRYKSPTDGRMKQVAIGQWPAVTVQAAAAQWQALREQRGEGADPAAQRRTERQSALSEVMAPKILTVRLLVEAFITGHLKAQRKAAGARAGEVALLRLLDEQPTFAQMPAASVTRSVAFEVLDSKKATPTAAAKLRSLLGAGWDYALDAGRLDGEVPNWWRMVMKGRLKSKGKLVGGKHQGQQRRVLRAGEIGELLGWLPNMHELGSDATQMYLWTCARGVEIFGMRPEHVAEEADGWWWTVPKGQTKNARFSAGVDLRVPLIGRALEIVRRRLDAVGESGWLFEDARGEQYEQKDFSTYIYSLQPYSEKVSRRESEGLVIPVAGWSPHDLRRTGRTLLASLGCRDEIAEAIIGHLPKDIVGIYNAYTYDAERRHWLGELSRHLEGLAMPAQDGLPARP
ncbi:tyrosine-type recombinase/integrase [Polaromonas jejuensis]|uniref:Tyrosine-type recombinase/integrase n=1 Tax=Polaromonas jejuensis TaxID=457502 RepID=A0ABW0QHE7_9BURK|nr:integrase arm-type DNA-binding domain-containing protein [Polaromonas jejuensis]